MNEPLVFRVNGQIRLIITSDDQNMIRDIEFGFSLLRDESEKRMEAIRADRSGTVVEIARRKTRRSAPLLP
jgi:hypothetical protein